MRHYERLRRKKLGDLLVDEQAANDDAVISALLEHHKTNTPLSQILLDEGELREYDLARIMVEQYQLPFLELDNYTHHRDLIATFPASLLHQARILPLDRFGEVVCFVVQEFPSDEVITELAKHGTERFFLYTALANEIRRALHDHAPLSDDEREAGISSAEEPRAAGEEDGAWRELFDTANEAIVSALPDEPETNDEPSDADAEKAPANKSKQPAADDMPEWLSDDA